MGAFGPQTPRDYNAITVAAAGFDTVIIGGVHYRPVGNVPDTLKPAYALYLNSAPVADTVALEVWMQALKPQPPSPSAVKRLLVTFGGSGCQCDFDSMAATWDEFNATFSAFYKLYGLDGFDMNPECTYVDDTPCSGGSTRPANCNYDSYQVLFQNLTTLAQELGAYITMAPITQFGLDDPSVDMAVKTTQAAGLNGNTDSVMSWLNAQVYGETGTACGERVPNEDYYSAFYDYLHDAMPNLAENIVYFGNGMSYFEAASGMGYCVRNASTTYASPGNSVLPLAGAYIWQTYDMLPPGSLSYMGTPHDWASNITWGLDC